jgi:transcriptional regulator with XRE-family HTH domain
MSERSIILREVMERTGTSQSALARMSGVKRPSINQFLADRAPFSDDMLARLLNCMGHTLEITRHAAPADLGRSDRLRWALHRRLAENLDDGVIAVWSPTVHRNLNRLASTVRGEPHVSNLGRWERAFRDRDLREIRHAMTDLDDDAIALREVSPLSGLLGDADRARVLAEVHG